MTTTKTELFVEIVTTPEDLIYHNKANDMCLRILNTLAGSSILCIILKELNDSFLVALPCKLMAYGEKRMIEPYMPVRFVRFFKPTILAAIPCFGEFEQFYIKWLLDNGNQLYPDVVNGAFLELLTSRYAEINKEVSVMKESLKSIAEKEETSESNSAIMATPDSRYKH